VGGNTPDGPAAETWAYDVVQDVWARVESALGLPARSGLGVAVLADALYVFGGRDAAAELDDTWRLPVEG
jgi:Kelch motif